MCYRIEQLAAGLDIAAKKLSECWFATRLIGLPEGSEEPTEICSSGKASPLFLFLAGRRMVTDMGGGVGLMEGRGR